TVLLPELFHAEKPPASILIRSDEPDQTRKPEGPSEIRLPSSCPITSMTQAPSKKTAPCETWSPAYSRTAYETAVPGGSTTRSTLVQSVDSGANSSETNWFEPSASLARTDRYTRVFGPGAVLPPPTLA